MFQFHHGLQRKETQVLPLPKLCTSSFFFSISKRDIIQGALEAVGPVSEEKKKKKKKEKKKRGGGGGGGRGGWRTLAS